MKALLVFAMTLAAAAQAEDLFRTEEVKTIPVGAYTSTAPRFLGLSLTQWAGGQYLLSGKVKDAVQNEDFNALVAHKAGNLFVGEGSIYGVTYKNNASCAFPIKVEVYVYPDKLFVKHHGPTPIPYQYDECEGGHYDWTKHEEPYTLKPADGTRG